MKFVSYNKEYNVATKQLIDVFDNIVIKRFVGNAVQKSIHVPCVYGNRSRILKSLENKNKTLSLPIIAISKQSIARDTSRVHSVNEGLMFMEPNFNLNDNVAVPVIVTFDVTILTKFETDMDQIISNFTSMMNPDIYVVWPNPKGQGNMISQIIWDGSINIEHPEEIGETDPWRIMASTSMEYKTWTFPGEGIFDNTITGTETGLNANGINGRIKYINICEGSPLTANFDIEGANIGSEQKWNRWYDVPSYMTVDEYAENIAADLIDDNNFDDLGVILSISGGYYVEVYGLSGNTLYSTRNKDDLLYMVNNFDNIEITMLTQDGNLFYPEYLDDYNWLPTWESMLSGNLSCCFVDNTQTLYWLSNEDESLSYILLGDDTPIRLEP